MSAATAERSVGVALQPLARASHCLTLPGWHTGSMKQLYHSLAFASLILLGGRCLADDSLSRVTPTKHQSMRECIEKQKTADVSMSKSQMTRLCKDEMKRQKELGESAPPAHDIPHES
jgi:hypothetical protein